MTSDSVEDNVNAQNEVVFTDPELPNSLHEPGIMNSVPRFVSQSWDCLLTYP
jgi:hypothetical protein